MLNLGNELTRESMVAMLAAMRGFDDLRSRMLKMAVEINGMPQWEADAIVEGARATVDFASSVIDEIDRFITEVILTDENYRVKLDSYGLDIDTLRDSVRRIKK